MRPHDFLESFLAGGEVRDLSPLTLRNYRQCCERFLGCPTTPEDATAWDDMTLVAWIQSLRRAGLADGTIAYHQRHVYPWIRWMRKRRAIIDDPTDLVPIVEPREVQRRVLDAASFVRLVVVQGDRPRLPSGDFSAREHRLRGLAMLHVLRDTGVRRAELIALDLGDLDQRNRALVVRITKNRKIREVYFTPQTKAVLAEYIAGERGSAPGPLFMTRSGGRLTVAAAVTWLRRLSDLAGVDASFHDFRRAAATGWARAGMAYPDIQKLLGHETPAMSLIYAESARQDTARDAYRRVVG